MSHIQIYPLIVFTFISLVGCSEIVQTPALDPKAYPFIVNITESHPLKQGNKQAIYTIHDINHDGDDEIVSVDNNLDIESPLVNVTVKTQDGKIINELNFPPATPLHFMNQTEGFLDVDNDGIDEVFLWVKKEDTIFAMIGNFAKEKWRKFPLAIKPDTVPYPRWDCSVSGCWFLDVDNDGIEDLLCYLYSQRSLKPRGIFVYDIETGKQLWFCPYGAVNSKPPTVVDVNDDGEEEILVSTFSPNNGVIANGIDDAHSYVLSISKEGEILWARTFGDSGTYTCAETFIDQHGKHEIAIIFGRDTPRLESSYVAILDGKTGDILRSSQKVIETYLSTSSKFIAHSESWSSARILVGSDGGKLYSFNTNLEIVNETQLPVEAKVKYEYGYLENCNTNNFPFSSYASLPNNQTIFLDSTFNVVAFLNQQISNPQIIQRGIPQNLKLVFESEGNQCIANVKSNPFYIVYRYKYALLIIFFIGVAYISVVATRKLNFYYWLYIQILRRSEMEGIIVIDKRQRIVHLNSTALSILGLEQPIKKTLNWQEILVDPGLLALTYFINNVTKMNESKKEELIITIANEPKHVVLSIAPIRNLIGRRIGWLLLLVDITKTIEHDRIMNWAAVARNLAHEMKTPLGTILLNTEYVREQLNSLPNGLASSYEPKLRTVREEIDRLNDYVKNFMKLANLQPPNLLPSDINEVIGDILIFYEKRKPATVILKKEFEEDLPLTLIDVNLFTAAFINLLDNAVQAMAGNGILTVKTLMAHELMENNHAIEISVEDTGRGISAEDMPEIFQPFFTKSVSGTGLGLVITKKVVEDHGGTITFTSTVGKGTQFYIRIPIIKPGNGVTNE